MFDLQDNTAMFCLQQKVQHITVWWFGAAQQGDESKVEPVVLDETILQCTYFGKKTSNLLPATNWLQPNN